jgi:hypothetical protein
MPSLAGHWLGRFDGSWPGVGSLEIEAFRDAYLVLASAFSDDPNMPGSHVSFYVPIDATEHHEQVPVFAADPVTGGSITHEEALARGYNVPHLADVSIKLEGDNQLLVSWSTDIGTSGSTVARAFAAIRNAGDVSPLPARKVDWSEFRTIVEAALATPEALLFRGQPYPWRLRTSFHRTGKSNLNIYNNQTIPELHRTLSAQTRHYFRIGDPEERGAFYALAQHHGFPTPLLDWTRSPYVAAYFAFRRLPTNRDENGFARIFMFRAASWQADHLPISWISLVRPHVSRFETIMIGNSRISPQQGLFTLANVDDIESFVMAEQIRLGRQQPYLEVLDIPLSMRDNVMGHLASMGITAASMFPGLDGVCEAFSWKIFRT